MRSRLMRLAVRALRVVALLLDAVRYVQEIVGQ